MSPQKKHILVLAEWFPNSEDPQLGSFIQKQTELLSPEYEVSLIYIHPSNRKNIELEKEFVNGVQVIRNYYTPSRLSLVSASRYLSAFRKAANMVNTPPDLCILQVVGKNYLAYRKNFSSTPYMIMEHWSGYLGNTKASLIPGSLWKRALHQANSIFVASPALQKALSKRLPEKTIEILPNVIEARASSYIKENVVKEIFMISDLVDEIKNISGAFTALSSLPKDLNWKLTLIGDGPDRAALQQLAENLAINDKISFEGRKTNDVVLESLNKADLVIVNSRKETFSMVAAESLAAGKTLICTRCGGPEWFLNDNNSILIPVDDNASLSRAIEKVLRNEISFDADQLKKDILEKFGKERVRSILLSEVKKIIP